MTRKTLSLSTTGKSYGSMWRSPSPDEAQTIQQQLLNSVQLILAKYEQEPAHNYVEEKRKSLQAVRQLSDSLKDCYQKLEETMRYPIPRKQFFEEMVNNIKAQLNNVGVEIFKQALNTLPNAKSNSPRIVDDQYNSFRLGN